MSALELSIIIVITELITAVHSLTPVGRSRPEKRMWTDHPLTQFPQWSGGRAQCSGLQWLRADTLVDHGVRSRRPPVDTLVDRGVKDPRRPSRCQTVANQAGASEIRTLQCMATQGQGKRMLSADQLWLMGCWAVDASTPSRLLRA